MRVNTTKKKKKLGQDSCGSWPNCGMQQSNGDGDTYIQADIGIFFSLCHNMLRYVRHYTVFFFFFFFLLTVLVLSVSYLFFSGAGRLFYPTLTAVIGYPSSHFCNNNYIKGTPITVSTTITISNTTIRLHRPHPSPFLPCLKVHWTVSRGRLYQPGPSTLVQRIILDLLLQAIYSRCVYALLPCFTVRYMFMYS